MSETVSSIYLMNTDAPHELVYLRLSACVRVGVNFQVIGIN